MYVDIPTNHAIVLLLLFPRKRNKGCDLAPPIHVACVLHVVWGEDISITGCYRDLGITLLYAGLLNSSCLLSSMPVPQTERSKLLIQVRSPVSCVLVRCKSPLTAPQRMTRIYRKMDGGYNKYWKNSPNKNTQTENFQQVTLASECACRHHDSTLLY